MKYNISNDHINGIVDALGEEYKDLLVEKALAQHGTYDVDQINISTLIKIDEKAKETLYNDERRAKKKSIDRYDVNTRDSILPFWIVSYSLS